jgi:tetratricopeptide (TPR) repeat protein
VLLRKLKRPKDALDAYRSGSINARRNATVYAGRIAGVYIGTGQKAEAEHYLKALMNAEYPELAQAGQYYTGIHLATQEQYDAARDTLSALAEAAPSSPFANDAIETAWTLEEALKLGPESLDDFAAAMKADLVGDTLAAVTRLQAITARGMADPLRPRAMQRLGLIFFDAGSYDAALDVLGRFLAEYPENDQCPVVQRAIGRTYEVGLGQYAAALKAYERVLMNYPNYAMLDDARNDVQRVRAITKGNTYAP